MLLWFARQKVTDEIVFLYYLTNYIKSFRNVPKQLNQFSKKVVLFLRLDDQFC